MTDEISKDDENVSLISRDITLSTIRNLSLATSDLVDYNENAALLCKTNDIEMVEKTSTLLSIRESDIVQYGEAFKQQMLQENVDEQNNSDSSHQKILNNDSDTGLYEEKSTTTTSNFSSGPYKKNDRNFKYFDSNQCCATVCNPQIKFIKNKSGKYEGVVSIYGKSFSYKQIVGFTIFFISFILVVSAIAVNSWTFCEGTTAMEHSILLIWSHDKVSISVGEKAYSSMDFKNIVNGFNNLNQSDILKPLPTVFDDEYDYTKWEEIQKALHAQSDKRDLISLLEWSQNNLIADIEYGLYLMHIFNIFCVCFLGILMVLIIIFGDRYYKIQYLLTFMSFLSVILSIVYWGLANRHIEQYNHLLWCHTGNSFIVLSTGMANLFLILFIFTLPKRQDLHKYDVKKHNYSVGESIQSELSSKTDRIETVESEDVSLGDTIANSTNSEITAQAKHDKEETRSFNTNVINVSEDESLEDAILGDIKMEQYIES